MIFEDIRLLLAKLGSSQSQLRILITSSQEIDTPDKCRSLSRARDSSVVVSRPGLRDGDSSNMVGRSRSPLSLSQRNSASSHGDQPRLDNGYSRDLLTGAGHLR